MLSTSDVKQLIFTHFKPLLIFMTIGALTAFFYISIFTILLKFAHLHYQIAISISYVISVIFYFLANRRFTFKNSSNKTSQQLPRYFTLLAVNYLITLIVMHASVELFHLNPTFGIIAAIGITFMMSYSLSRFWIFKSA